MPKIRIIQPPSGRRLGVLISGKGSNLKAILDEIAAGNLNAEVALVLSNRKKAGGLELARKAGIPTVVLSHRPFPDRESYDQAVLEILREHRVDLVCLAGFMRILSRVIVDAYPDCVVNIHPSLLPAFRGLDAPRQALDYGARIAGCTAHFVNEELDRGPIILQAGVRIRAYDTHGSLTERILELEHDIFPRAIGMVLDGGLRVVGRRILNTPDAVIYYGSDRLRPTYVQ